MTSSMTDGFDKAAALAWIRKSLTINHGKYPPFILGKFEAQVVSQLRALDIDVTDRQLALDYDGVRHTYVKHGNALIEATRHQRAIVAADFLLVPDIVQAGVFQLGEPAFGRDGTRRLTVTAILQNAGLSEEFSVVFSVRKKLVVLHTMWIHL